MTMKRVFNYNEIHKKCEKLYSNIFTSDIYNLCSKEVKWKMFNEEMRKVIKSVQGEYDSLIVNGEIFSIGDKIQIHFMTGRIAIIKSIIVRLDYCTWKPEYTIISEDIHTDEVYKNSYDVCVHLV